jgi:hypothetical protein
VTICAIQDKGLSITAPQSSLFFYDKFSNIRDTMESNQLTNEGINVVVTRSCAEADFSLLFSYFAFFWMSM